MDRRIAVGVSCAALLCAAGCERQPGMPKAATSAPTLREQVTGAALTPAGSPGPTDALVAQSEIDGMGAGPAVGAARQAYAEEVGVDAADVQVIAVEPVTWSDSSLGCGKPGEMYLQVLTPGYRIVLSVDGNEATYHTDRGNGRPPTVVRCDAEKPVSAFEPMPQIDLDDLTAGALDMARLDLEERLGAGTAFELQGTRVADVGDLVCEGTPAAASGGPGRVILEIRLKAGRQVHLYRAWGDEVIYCGIVEGPVTE